MVFVRDDNERIDISSAAQGPLSTVPCGATQQTFLYPGTAYRFDPLVYSMVRRNWIWCKQGKEADSCPDEVTQNNWWVW